jgi:hypothetical protein
VVDGAIARRATMPAVLLGREGGGGRRSADVVFSLTAIRVLAGTKNSCPVGFYSRNSTKSTVNPNTTIPQICLAGNVAVLDVVRSWF